MSHNYHASPPQLTILFQNIEFRLSSQPQFLPDLRGLPTFDTGMQMLADLQDDPFITANVSVDIARVMTERFWPTLLVLATKHAFKADEVNLGALVSRRWYKLSLANTDDVSIDDAQSPYGVEPFRVNELPRSIMEKVFKVRASALTALDNQAAAQTLQGRVRFPSGTTAWFKPVVTSEKDRFLRELDVMHHITTSGNQIRVPKLIALVIADNDDKRVAGLLMTSIKGKTLAERRNAAVPPHLKDRWREQLEQTLRLLHSCGVSWGLLDEENMIVDEKDNAWLIRFYGSRLATDNSPLLGPAKFENFEMLRRVF